MVHLGKIGLELNQGGVAAITGIFHQFNQFAYDFPLSVLKRLAETVNCRVFWTRAFDTVQFLLDQSAPQP
jgi:hypothetical protein